MAKRLDEKNPDEQRSESQQVAKLDLTKYRTRELVAHLTELISIPGAFMKVVLTSFVLMIAVGITVMIMFWNAQLSGLMWILVCAYALLCGATLGPLLGILRVIYAGLGNIEEILKTILSITRQAANDTENLQTGAARLPSGGELVAQIYDGVLMPALEQSIEGVFSVFGTPVLWLYRRTIGSSVRYLIRKVEPPKLTEEQHAEIQQQVEQGITTTAKYSVQIEKYTDRAAEMVGTIGGGIRMYVMRPLFLAYCVLLLVAVLPILFYRWWFGTPVETEQLINEVNQHLTMLATARGTFV